MEYLQNLDLSSLPFVKDTVEIVIKQAISMVAGRLGNRVTSNRLQRIEESLEALNQHLAESPGPLPDVEAQEPAIEDFLAHAFEVASSSPTEAKRRFLGDLIGRRLTVQAASLEARSLNLSLRIVEDATEIQLVLLGNIWFFRNEHGGALATLDAVEAWLATRNDLVASPLAQAYTLADIDHLESIGAVRQGSRARGAFLGDPTSAASHWLRALGVQVGDIVQVDKARFPLIASVAVMFQGAIRREQFEAGGAPSIADVDLTPAGTEIGRLVVRRLAKNP